MCVFCTPHTSLHSLNPLPAHCLPSSCLVSAFAGALPLHLLCPVLCACLVPAMPCDMYMPAHLAHVHALCLAVDCSYLYHSAGVCPLPCLPLACLPIHSGHFVCLYTHCLCAHTHFTHCPRLCACCVLCHRFPTISSCLFVPAFYLPPCVLCLVPPCLNLHAPHMPALYIPCLALPPSPILFLLLPSMPYLFLAHLCNLPPERKEERSWETCNGGRRRILSSWTTTMFYPTTWRR